MRRARAHHGQHRLGYLSPQRNYTLLVRHGDAQAWQWSDDGSQVDISLFVLRETPGGWSASVHETTYRALLRAEMNAALVQADFSQIRWLMPDVTGYYQPIVVARSAP